MKNGFQQINAHLIGLLPHLCCVTIIKWLVGVHKRSTQVCENEAGS